MENEKFFLFSGMFIALYDSMSDKCICRREKAGRKEEDVTEKLYNLSEEDYDGISITAGTKKKSYLPFEKIKLVLSIKNTGYPEIQNVKSKLEAPAGYKISGDDTAERESLGLSETFTITYDTYNAKGILMFLGVCAGLLVLLVFFFLFFIFIRNRKRRRQFIASILVLVMLGHPTVTFAKEYTEYGLKEFLEQETEVTDSFWSKQEVQFKQKVKLGLFSADFTHHIAYEQQERLRVEISKTSKESLTLKWDALEGIERYEIYRKTGASDYDLYDETTDDSYKVKALSGSEINQFQVVGYKEEDGTAILSNECRYIYLEDKEFIDSDGDNLPDDVEEAYGLSNALADTDGDGLLDSTEVYTSFTDPLKADTDGDGVNDGEEDLDRDGLTNLEEQEIGTNPLTADTDQDGLLDGEEWEGMYSDPLTADSDDDGLTDAQEKEFGTDPWEPDTNGDGILDRDDTYEKDYQMVGSDSVFTVKAPAEALTRAELLDYTDSSILKDKEYVVSEVTCMNMEDAFEEAQVTMRIQEDKVPDGDLENVAMFYYNEDKNAFEMMEDQEYDEETGTITAPTAHFSTFVLVYVPNWHTQFDNDISPDRTQDGVTRFADVSFVIDESSSMEDGSKSTANDPNRYRVEAAKRFTEALIEGDRADVVGFTTDARRKCEMTENMDEVRMRIDEIVGNGGGTAMYNGLLESLNGFEKVYDEERSQFIIALSDGEDNERNEEAYAEIKKKASDYGIAIYTIALGASVDASLLSDLAIGTGGDFFRISNAEDLPLVYSRIANNAVYGEDTDKDGLADEVEDYGIRDGLGNTYNTDKENPDTDGDDLEDGVEVGDLYYNEGEEQYYIVLSDPTNPDTDGDGLDDFEEWMQGTLVWCSDTDGDGLTDGFESDIGFDPLAANTDGDAFGDYAEYYDLSLDIREVLNMDEMDEESGLYVFCSFIANIFDKDPYGYDLSSPEAAGCFLSAIIVGDFGDVLAKAGVVRSEYTDSIYYLAGNIVGNFVPGISQIADVRDLIANLITGNIPAAALNAIGVLPLAGDAAQSVADFTKALASKMDDAAKLTRIMLWISDAFQFSAKVLYTANAFIEAAKKVAMNGLKHVAKRESYKIVTMMEDFQKYVADAKVYYAADLIKGTDDAITLATDGTGSSQKIAYDARKKLGNQAGGKVYDDIVDGKNQKVYEKVRVMNLDAATYKNASGIESSLNKNVDDMLSFGGNGKISMDGVTQRRLKVAIPNTIISKEGSETLLKVQQEAAGKGVIIDYTVYTATGKGGTILDDVNKIQKAAGKTGEEVTEDLFGEKLPRYLKEATHNADADTMYLGKYHAIKDESGEWILQADSYDVIAAKNGGTYFSLEDAKWNQIENDYGKASLDRLNKQFLIEQTDAGKKIIITHDPLSEAFRKDSAFGKEMQFLEDKGYEFIKSGDFWEAVRK